MSDEVKLSMANKSWQFGNTFQMKEDRLGFQTTVVWING